MAADDVFYQAMLARDYRFDGKFFVGVKTTGVYCRPICPAKPRRENVEFFADALSAERAGYRPCLRCRPECAPSSPAWHGTSAVVQRALRLIAANALLDVSEEQFAAQLGVTARHLRRLFAEEIGRTPKQVSDDNRLNFARKLVVETRMPIATVALTAGFASIRRFNDAFRARFGRAPSQLRRTERSAASGDGITLSLAYRPPLDWQAANEFYARHQIAGVERVTPDCYERVFRIGKSVGLVRVRPDEEHPVLRVGIWIDDPVILFEVVHRVRRMFDLDSDPVLVANSFAESPVLKALYGRWPGLRLVHGWDPFESAVCCIMGQCISVSNAYRLAGQLVQRHGEPTVHPLTGEQVRLFPTPAKLAAADLADLPTTSGRRRAIQEFSRQVASGGLSLSPAQAPEAFKKKLLAIKGLGPWSAEYISLRAIGDTDAFPGTDLVLKRALEAHADLDLERVKPWRSYAAVYLWRAYARRDPAEGSVCDDVGA